MYIVQQVTAKYKYLRTRKTDGLNRIQRNREYENSSRVDYLRRAAGFREDVYRPFAPGRTRPGRADVSSLNREVRDLLRRTISGEKTKLMIAQSRIDDSVVNHLRGTVLARDLVFEKVNDDAR